MVLAQGTAGPAVEGGHEQQKHSLGSKTARLQNSPRDSCVPVQDLRPGRVTVSHGDCLPAERNT